MKAFRFGLTQEVVINIVLLMLVSVALISLVVIKITGDAIIRERYEGLKTHLAVFSRVLGPLIAEGKEGQVKKVEQLIREMEFPGRTRLEIKEHQDPRMAEGARIVVVEPKGIEPLAVRSGPEGKEVGEEDRLILRLAIHQGKVQTEIQRPDGGSKMLHWLSVFPAGRLRLASPVVFEGQLVGGVLVEYSLRGITGSVVRILRVIVLYLILDTVLIALLGIYLIVRLAVRPLKALMGATEKVAQGNLAVKVPEAGPTEIQALARSFNRMVERIKTAQEKLVESQQHMIQSEKLASVGRMASGLAHELGNPLGALIGYVHILLKSGNLTPEQIEMVERVRDEAHRLDRTIKGLLEFSRPAPPEIQELDVNKVAGRAVGLIEKRKVAGEVTFTVDLAPGLSPVKGDPGQLEQVMVNLIMNAVDALSEQEPPREIEIATSGSGGQVFISIRDNGPGIQPSDREKIFDPFYTSKCAEKGTGLGLSVSLQLIRSMKGNITVESTPGEGARFTIRLPVEGKSGSPQQA